MNPDTIIANLVLDRIAEIPMRLHPAVLRRCADLLHAQPEMATAARDAAADLDRSLARQLDLLEVLSSLADLHTT